MRPTTRDCLHFDIRNIALPSPTTLDTPGGRAGMGWNNLQVYLGQVPMLAPHGYLVFDLATVPVRYLPGAKKPQTVKTPNTPYITLDQYSFVLLEGAP